MSDTVKNEAMPAEPQADDVMARARWVRIEVMEGRGGRGAQARLMAASQILEAKNLELLTDEELSAEVDRLNVEVRRRNALAAEREP